MQTEENVIATLLPSADSLSHILATFDFSHLKAGDVVIDVGSGQSALVAYLRSHGVQAYGVDAWYSNMPAMDERFHQGVQKLCEFEVSQGNYLSPEFLFGLHESRALFHKDRAANPSHYIPGKLSQLPFSSNSTKLIVSGSCIAMAEEPDIALFSEQIEECIRVLEPEGELQFWPFFGGMSFLSSAHHYLRQKYHMQLAQIGFFDFRATLYKQASSSLLGK
jgi:ubiquinone/menaquinone biosynthesis C-methylase UbiE